MDYQGLYEDILAIERRAIENGLEHFAHECFRFRADLLLGHCCFVARVYV